MMSQYGVQKPLFVNEIGLTCPEYYSDLCNPPASPFYNAQADFLVRSFVRGLNENLMGFSWYTLNGPNWRYGGLQDEQGQPTLTYTAYQQLITQLKLARFKGPVLYADGAIEAYDFYSGAVNIQVVWMKTGGGATISIPMSNFIAAYARDGSSISPPLSGNTYQVSVGFSPIYLVLKP